MVLHKLNFPFSIYVFLQISSPNVSENCNSLEAELDHVKLEIVKMMSEKEEKSKEANRVQSYEKKISELEEQNILLKKEILMLATSNKTESCNQIKAEENIFLPDILIDRSPPDGQEREDKCLSSSPSLKMEVEKEGSDQENIKILEENK